ncbi:hypothetical protein L2E82_18165 [Cichorium intybus]|uniref:Uncharacterized protein n=1 Tax=Cichorium intybus TaxID=13427 RepID=A0ACB9F9X1_CICIN|nr:hypothetical protein L2E82_18165 [Cichorium intybus]
MKRYPLRTKALMAGVLSAISDIYDLIQFNGIEGVSAVGHFQCDIVRGVEGFIVIGSKQVEIGTKLSEDGRKYGAENTCTSVSALSKAAMSYSSARTDIEREHENLLKYLGTQVAEPFRAMVVGTPLEDARRHAQRYDRVIEVASGQAKVEAEKHHHHKVLNILDRLEVEMLRERQRIEFSPMAEVTSPMSSSPSHDEINGVFASEREVSTACNRGEKGSTKG